MKNFYLLQAFGLTCLLLSLSNTSSAQVDTVSPAKTSSPTRLTKTVFRKNIAKINLSSLAFNSYNFNYERSLSRKITFVAGYNTMGKNVLGDLPLTEKITKQFLEKDNDIVNDLNKISVANNAYTGEFRFYGGRRPGARGAYLSLYGRYSNMKLDYDYDYEGPTKNYLIPIRTEVKGFGGGLMFGVQKLIAKRVALDIYIIGAHYGNLKGNADAAVDLSAMPATEKADLKEEIEALAEINGKRYVTATVVDKGVSAKADGPLIGIRGLGFSLGIAF
jgi:hypothetical protein